MCVERKLVLASSNIFFLLLLNLWVSVRYNQTCTSWEQRNRSFPQISSTNVSHPYGHLILCHWGIPFGRRTCTINDILRVNSLKINFSASNARLHCWVMIAALMKVFFKFLCLQRRDNNLIHCTTKNQHNYSYYHHVEGDDRYDNYAGSELRLMWSSLLCPWLQFCPFGENLSTVSGFLLLHMLYVLSCIKLHHCDSSSTMVTKIVDSGGSGIECYGCFCTVKKRYTTSRDYP